MGGRKFSKKDEIYDVFNSYFLQLFQSSQPSWNTIKQCTQFVEKRITDDMNNELLHPFTEEEIQVALNQMAPLKAPGPDRYGACFYQGYWNIVGTEINSMVLDFLNGGMVDESFYYTNIVLIPKSKNPTKSSDFRLISLYNVIYKIASKVLINRLKPIMPAVIFNNQSAFLSSRLITDN